MAQLLPYDVLRFFQLGISCDIRKKRQLGKKGVGAL